MAGKDLASRLRERVTIETQQTEDNGRGGRRATGWVALVTVWAEVIPLRGDEALDLSVVRASQLWRVTIRNRSGVTTVHRLRWKDVTMDIRTAAATPDRSALVMTAESREGA